MIALPIPVRTCNNFKTLETKVSEIDVSSEIKALESKMQLLNKETEQISEIIKKDK